MLRASMPFKTRLILSLALAAVSPFPAIAAAAHSTASSQSVVRIVNQLGREQSIGSGTLIHRRGDYGVVLTCAHIFSDDVGKLIVFFDGGTARVAQVLAIDEKNDLASLLVARPPTAAVSLAKALPPSGSPLASCGFGQQGQFLINRGQSLGQVTLEEGEPEGVVELSGAARQGDSGGPIFDARGQLVAVIFGSDGNVVDGTHCGVIRPFLARHPISRDSTRRLAELAARPLDTTLLVFRPTGGNEEAIAQSHPAFTTLRGTVRYGKRAASGVRVELKGPTTRVAKVDHEGRFVFERVAAGHYELAVDTVMHNQTRSALQSVWLSGEADVEQIELRLE